MPVIKHKLLDVLGGKSTCPIKANYDEFELDLTQIAISDITPERSL
jgi:hypothetical protein